MSRTPIAVAVAACLALSAHTAQAQEEGFRLGYTDIGATVGLGGIGSASLAFGLRAERALRALPEIGDGLLGIQLAADYYNWSSGPYSWSYMPIGVTANYHHPMENRKIDPFVGLGLGYSIVSCSWDGFGSNLCGSSNALYFIGRAGARYFLNERMALYGDVGAGAATLNVGATFRLQ
jgi:hypothetical protein